MGSHIEDGEYCIYQNKRYVGEISGASDSELVEVGRVVVQNEVEHWFLCRAVPEDRTGHARYTVPSSARSTPAVGFPRATTVGFVFRRVADAPSLPFDASTYKRSLPADITWFYIRATPRSTPVSTPRYQSEEGQIDWGIFNIFLEAGEDPVGYVEVKGHSGVETPLESWSFFATYAPPGAAGGRYTLSHTSEPPRGAVTAQISLDCSSFVP